MKRCFLLLALFILACCANDTGRPLADGCYPRIDFAADESFTLEERVDLQEAAKEWYEFSSGRYHPTITFAPQSSPEHPYIHRVLSNDPLILEVEEYKRAEYGVEEWSLAGLAVVDHQMYLVMDRISREQFQGVALHELGHNAGLGHSMDATAVMCGDPAPTCDSPKQLGPADLTFCQATCQCE